MTHTEFNFSDTYVCNTRLRIVKCYMIIFFSLDVSNHDKTAEYTQKKGAISHHKVEVQVVLLSQQNIIHCSLCVISGLFLISCYTGPCMTYQYWDLIEQKGANLSIQRTYSSMFLTHWDLDKKAAIFQKIFSNACSWMKMYQFRLRFHWSLFPRVLLTILQHWFR